ncbi:barstar family protein [Cellulomonas xylanilytica]|uniref:Barstar (barnase inhibitor) domain-containing protein n=1 Tax=Cellulomonas xylanilytica TaxID=233583 RepID=A0A510V0V1_9CELL|nr:barstar family protein [Cellulomonas xylanilytica]GEK20522.1 hypothetical protein CXY01_10420 [Cellulomonas xylanilytica]
MPIFDLDANVTHPADFNLVRGGGVALYLDPAVLREAEEGLDMLAYDRTRIDAASWDELTVHDAVAAALNFPSYYGRNLDAMADCLSDVAHGDYGWNVERTGLAVTVANFGAFARRQPTLATVIADLFAGTSGYGLLFGHRLLWLLHVDQPHFQLGPIGGCNVPWNGREWSDSARG